MSELLSLGQTPEEWSKHLAGHGVHVSPRLIRSKARATGNYRQLGHLMLLLPSHIEALAEPGTPENDQKERPAVQSKTTGEEG